MWKTSNPPQLMVVGVVTVYLGLGANLGEPDATFDRAVAVLEERAISVLRESSRHRTEPMGPKDQPVFLNSVVETSTELRPDLLLNTVKAIEIELGRAPSIRWGPRMLDIDILVYGDEVVEQPNLRIPHVGLAERMFVLQPLAELAPNLVIPGAGATVGALLQRLRDD